MKTKPIVAAVLSASATNTPLSLQSKWIGSLITANSSAYPLTYNFSLAGDSVMGTAKSTLDKYPIKEGKLDTAGLHFELKVNGPHMYHAGTVYANSTWMNISLNGSVAY